MIYLFIIIVTYILAMLTVVDKKIIFTNWTLESLLLVSFFIIYVGGLRFNVGSDWASYVEIYKGSNLGESADGVEPGYLLLNKFFNYLNIPYSIFVLFIFTLSYTLKIVSFQRYSSNVFVALIVYIPIQFMVYDINAVRQGLAVGITLTTIPFILERKLFPFLIICLSACTIHITAIVFIPFYWLALKSISDRRSIFILLFFIFIALVSKLILDVILQRLGTNFSLFEKFIYYTVNEEYNKNLSFNLSTIYRILIFVLFVGMHKKMKIKESIYLLLRNGYLLSLCIYFTFFSVELIATRGSLYFRVFDVFMFSYLITSFNKLYLRQVFLAILVLYSCLQVFVTLSMENNGLLPYNNILFLW